MLALQKEGKKGWGQTRAVLRIQLAFKNPEVGSVRTSSSSTLTHKTYLR